MAQPIRCAKSGNAWTANELRAYNIEVCSQSAKSFFGYPLPTLDGIDPLFVSATVDTDGLTHSTDRLLRYLVLASKANPGQGSAISDFSEALLSELGYEEDGTILRYRYAIPLAICGNTRKLARTGVCLVHVNAMILLIIQGGDTTISPRVREARVIAGAIAAFQCNNHVRDQLGKPLLSSMTIPCITMIGTCPIFYKIPVTKELSEAVITAQYPTQTTLVTKCVVSSRSGHLREGMEVPDFREAALQHFVAFRALAKHFWSAFLCDGNGV